MGRSPLSARSLEQLLGNWREGSTVDYTALAERIRILVTDGRMVAGSRLPSERVLATRLGVSRTTVNSAYTSLGDSGYVTRRQGSGTTVRLPGRPGDLPIPSRRDIIDLSRATSSAIPGVHLAAQRALERLPARLGTDGYELSGLPELRRALAERFTTRGLPTTPDQIAVTSGSQSAISLLARVFVARGDCVVVESPGYPHANEAWRVAGGHLKSIAVDPVDGWDLDGFEQLVARTQPTLAFFMPDFQNPAARSMTEDDRGRVAHLADSLGFVVVADETTAELDIDRGGTRLPLAAHARLPDSVVTVGSASKTVWGGLRIGWVRASAEIIDRLVAARFSNDLGAAVLDQLVVSELLDDFDEVLARRCDALRRSRDTLVAAVDRHLPAAHVPHVEGGVAAWVHLGSPISSALTSAAREQGLLLGAGPWFGLDGEFERHTRIPITASPESIERAVRIMADVWPILSDRTALRPQSSILL